MLQVTHATDAIHAGVKSESASGSLIIDETLGEKVYAKYSKTHIVKYRFHIRIQEKAELPAYKGATLRGGLKTSYWTQFCSHKTLSCEACPLQVECPYPTLFEAVSKPEIRELRGQKFGSMAFVLQPPKTKLMLLPPGMVLSFNAVVVGPHMNAFPFLFASLQELGQTGLGTTEKTKQGRFALLRAEVLRADGTWQEIFNHQTSVFPEPHQYMRASDIPLSEDPYSRIKISFETPIRLRETVEEPSGNKSKRILQDFSFETLFASLCRRISSLFQDLEKQEASFDHKALFATAANAIVEEKKLDWFSHRRYSTRSQAAMDLDGVTGHMIVDKVTPLQLWLLRIGEFVHVGKQNSFGLGQLKIELLPKT